ncbi:MAG: ferredoxin [Actinomycetota bacterium]
MTGHVRVTIDSDVCIGMGQCEMLAPDVFGFDDDEAIAFAIDGATIERGKGEDIADRCPSRAISIVELDAGE